MLRTRCGLFALLRAGGSARADLASGMALSLFALVPGLLFSTNPTFLAPATHIPRLASLRTYEFRSFQKNDENHRVNDFWGPLTETPDGRALLGVEQGGIVTTQGDFRSTLSARTTSGDLLSDLFLHDMGLAADALDLVVLLNEPFKVCVVNPWWSKVAKGPEQVGVPSSIASCIARLAHGVEWIHVALWLDDKHKLFKDEEPRSWRGTTEAAVLIMHACVRSVACIVVCVAHVLRAVTHAVSCMLLVLLVMALECMASWCIALACCVTWVCTHPWAAKWMLLLVYGVVGVHSVTCMSCHDGVPGCLGGDSCPFANLPFINSEILRSTGGNHEETTTGDDGAETVVTHTLLVAVTVLPRVISRFLSRGVLDFFKTVARRPAAGAVPDVESMSEAELIQAVRGGSVTPDDALNSILTRLVSAPPNQVPKLNALVSTIGQMTKLKSASTMVGTGANGELLGIFTFAWTQAGRIVQHANAALAVAGEATSADTVESKVILQAKILRPRNQVEFAHMLTVWGMICHALGVANSLATGAFVLKVVFDQQVNFGLTWQQAHELFLVYLEAVETAHAGRGLTLANVYESGGQDMFREKALARAKEHFKGGSSADDKVEKTKTEAERIFRWGFNSSSTKCCLTFNLGRDKHPATAVDAKGKCIFNHKCDHWVSEQPDGTKGGICGSTKHGRHACDNPKRADTKVTG
jgi:hypothetical protein